MTAQLPARLVIVGEGPLRAELTALAAQLGIERQVDLVGFQPNPLPYMRRAAVVVLSSVFEGFAMVLAEALACGIPALISNKINIWREVQESGAGLVAADTEAGAIELLDRWISLGETGQDQMRSEAVPCFEEKFEITSATANLLATLETIVPAASRQREFVNA